MSIRLKRSKEAIDELFSDRSVDPGVTLDLLEQVENHVAAYIHALRADIGDDEDDWDEDDDWDDDLDDEDEDARQAA